MENNSKSIYKAIVKNLLLIFICATLGTAGAYIVSNYYIQPTYKSSVKLYVNTNDNRTQQTNNDYLNDLTYAQKVVNTYIEMLRTDSFYRQVKDTARLRYSVDDLKNMITFSVLNDTEVFQVSVLSAKPQEAKEIADIITELAPATISSINESAMLKVVDSAGYPEKPSAPNVMLNCVMGLFVGSIAAVLFVIFKERMDIRIKREEDLIAHYNIPILGSIPAFQRKYMRKIIF